MNIHILSDLHIEFIPFVYPEVKTDVVVLAGDIHTGQKGLKWAMQNIPHQPVVYVLGNHEYYGNAYPKLLVKMKDTASGSNVHILENDFVCINDVVFLGCTLWTDFELFGDPQLAGRNASQQLTDYKRIRVSPRYSKLRSLDTAMIHRQSVVWLKNSLAQFDSNKVVIVTHHAPSIKSIPTQYKHDLLSAAYASELDLISASQASMWIHGHVHESCNYTIGKTQVICNPRGYPDESNQFFNPELVVTIA